LEDPQRGHGNADLLGASDAAKVIGSESTTSARLWSFISVIAWFAASVHRASLYKAPLYGLSNRRNAGNLNRLHTPARRPVSTSCRRQFETCTRRVHGYRFLAKLLESLSSGTSRARSVGRRVRNVSTTGSQLFQLLTTNSRLHQKSKYWICAHFCAQTNRKRRPETESLDSHRGGAVCPPILFALCCCSSSCVGLC
jgi:hypothetical protein